MWKRSIIRVALSVVISSVAHVGQMSFGHAQVQGLDTPNRADCPGGFVEGLGCSCPRPVGPGIQDSDQGWQRDWRDFGAGDPGLSIIYGDEGGPRRFRPRFRD